MRTVAQLDAESDAIIKSISLDSRAVGEAMKLFWSGLTAEEYTMYRRAIAERISNKYK